jgi:membrane protein YdbS with pleckstrin-like domain
MFGSRDADDILLDTEHRVVRVRRHWAYLSWDVFEAIALLAAAVMTSYVLPSSMWLLQNILWYAALIVVLRFAYQVLSWWVERIVVTDQRMVMTTGLITTKVLMMPISKVTDLTYERPLMGRFLGYGTVIVESAGQIQALNRLDYLPKPEQVYRAIDELQFGDKDARLARFSMIKAQRLAKRKPVVG